MPEPAPPRPRFVEPHPDWGRRGIALPKGHCRWCRVAITAKRRRHWCSDACVQSFLICRPGFYRDRFVLERDGPCCAICGRDTVEAANIWNRIRTAAKALHDYAGAFAAVRHAFEEAWRPGGRFRLWEVDHRVPRALGGADHPNNFRLLCLRCHREETAKLVQTLKARRRELKQAVQS